MTNESFKRELLSASLSRMEFRAREQDGPYPAGLANAIAAMDGWLYGGDPKAALSFEEDFAFMREALNSDYYERVFEKYILNSAHSGKIILLPSKTLAQERLREEAERLDADRMKLTDAQMQEKRAALERLEAWQNTPDSKEELEKLPSLTLDDLSPTPQKYDYTVGEAEGTPLIYIPAASKGICYADMLFDTSDLDGEDIFHAALLCDLLKNVKTGKTSAVDLQTRIKNDLGSLYFSVMGFETDGELKTYIRAHMSFLESNRESALAIMEEITSLSDFLSEGKVITNFLKQTRSAAKESIITSGHSVAMSRIGAYTSAEAAVSEYTDGLEFYLRIKELTDKLDEKLPALLERLDALKKKIFRKERLTVLYTGKKDEYLEERLVSLFATGGVCPEASAIKPFGVRREGISIPSQVAYAGLGGNMKSATGDPRGHGSFAVARSILSLDYLWSKIRVQGGAYGCGLTHRITGLVAFYSYRDPSPARSVQVYRGAGESLRNLADSGDDITGFIIGTVGESDHLITPKLLGVLVLRDYIRGESYEDRAARRLQMINTTHEDIRAAADCIDKVCESAGICIVAGSDKLADCNDLIDNVIEI